MSILDWRSALRSCGGRSASESTLALRQSAGQRQLHCTTSPLEPQQSEHEKQHNSDERRDQQRAETAQAVREEEEHISARHDVARPSTHRHQRSRGLSRSPSLVANKRTDQLKQGLVFGPVCASTKELSDLGP